MSRKPKVRRTAGDVVAIPLGEGNDVGFGLVLDEPLVVFFDLRVNAEEAPPVEEIVRSPVAFRIWVMNKPIVDGTWPVIGRVSLSEPMKTKPWFFKQDPLSGEITIGRTGHEEFPAEPGQAERLERAAVWSAEHVVDRLKDCFSGRPNKWVESLRCK